MIFVIISIRYRKSLQKREESRIFLKEAINLRDAEKIEEGIDMCLKNGIDEATILQAREILLIVNAEDVLIREIIVLLKKHDIQELMEAVDKFK